ncbi:hypothetical protein BDW71DRAFT_186756 [Aspergillus fruticulosus]
MPQPTQPTRTMSVDGQKLRRLACDRCRGQKLKCVRLGSSEKCQRCDSAKAVCTFGKPLPPGRRASTRVTAQEMRTQPSVPKSPIAPPRNESENVQPSGAISTPAGILQPDSPGFADSSWVQGSDVDADHFYKQLYEEGGAVDFDDIMLDPWPTTADVMDDILLWQPIGLTGDGGGNLILDSHAGRSPQSQKRTMAAQEKREGSTKRPLSQISGSTTGSSEETVAAPSITGLMPKLMQLSCALYELENRYLPNGDSSQTLMASYSVFPTELAGQVLQAAIDFLGFLQYFFRADEHSSYSSSHALATGRRDQSLSDLTDLDHSCLQTFGSLVPPSYDHMSLPPISYPYSSSSEWPAPRQVSTPDKPTCLQLISNYMRLLRLYLLLHKAIYDYVRLTASTPGQRRPIWTDLTLGGTVLDQFADFHIKLVLQVAARLLEDIEFALGLPEGCRVGKMTAAEGSRLGILGTYVSTHFIEMCISEATTGTDQGREAILRLRDLMHRLSSILDTPTVC